MEPRVGVAVIIVRNSKILLGKRKGAHAAFMKAECLVGEPRVCEPDKLEEWGWFSPEQLPSPLMLPIANLLSDGYNL
ncbi:MAG: hypothetical protein R3A13_12500 [Bdellovibrionota bacterium]